MKLVPKIVGWESELPAITLADVPVADSFATRRIIGACPLRPTKADTNYLPVRCQRGEFLVNGARLYPENDQGLLEMSTPEQLSAREAVASLLASFHVVNKSRRLAEEAGDGEFQIEVLVSSANEVNSWGGHLNLLLSRETFDDIFGARQHLVFQLLIPFLATAPTLFGFGDLIDEPNGEVRFMPSARASFFGELMHHSTTQGRHRPIVNLRDEPLADKSQFARLHTISLDPSISPWAAWLKFGCMQLIGLALEMRLAPQQLILDNPIAAISLAGQDCSLSERIRLASGHSVTPLQVQRIIAEFIRDRIVEPGDAEPYVPEAEAIVTAWLDTVDMLAEDPTQAGRRVDWVTKKLLLERAVDESDGADWDDDKIRYLGLMYGSVDFKTNPFFDGRANFIPAAGADHAVTVKQVAALVNRPPPDTRAWVRGEILRRFPDVTNADWHRLKFRAQGQRWGWQEIELRHPYRLNEETCGEVVEHGTLEEIARHVEAVSWEPGSSPRRVRTVTRRRPATKRKEKVRHDVKPDEHSRPEREEADVETQAEDQCAQVAPRAVAISGPDDQGDD